MLHSEAPEKTVMDLFMALAAPKPQMRAKHEGGSFGDSYAESALRNECGIVAAARQGTRNDTLNKAAFNVGQLVAANALNPHAAEGRLLHAALSAGLDRDEAMATIHSAFDAAEAAPRQLPERRGHRTSQDASTSQAPRLLKARPYAFPDPANIPMREWLYSRFLIRGCIAVTVAPGGAGKSSLSIVEALAMASGRPFLGHDGAPVSRVWLFNLEDDADEMARRIGAACKHYNVSRGEVEGLLFVNSGLDDPLCVARQERHGVTIIAPVFDNLKAEVRAKSIDVLIVDPFVSCHQVPENDNGAIDRVAKEWARLAHECRIAVHLVHHARKTGGERVEVEDARGASALIAAARSARTLNVMSDAEAVSAGVSLEDRFSCVSITNGKTTFAKRGGTAEWVKLESVALGNGPLGTDGDKVGVVTPWRWPDPGADVTPDMKAKAFDAIGAFTGVQGRESVLSPEWAGHAVIAALGLPYPLHDKDGQAPAKTKAAALIKQWLKAGALAISEAKTKKHEWVKVIRLANQKDAAPELAPDPEK